MKFCCGTKTTSDVIRFLEDREDIPTSEMVCVQGLQDHSVLVSFRTEGPVNSLLEENTVYIDRIPVNVTRPDAPKWFVKVYYLPFQVTNDDVKAVLAHYGYIFNVRRDCHPNRSDILNGDRTVTMLVSKCIPSFLTIAGYCAKIWHWQQAQTCRLCNEEGHKASECDEVRCFRYKQLGHMASSCVRDVTCTSREESNHNAWRCPNKTRTRSISDDHDDSDDEVNEYPTLRSTETRPFDYNGDDENETNEGNEAVNEQLAEGADSEEQEEGETTIEVMD